MVLCSSTRTSNLALQAPERVKSAISTMNNFFDEMPNKEVLHSLLPLLVTAEATILDFGAIVDFGIGFSGQCCGCFSFSSCRVAPLCHNLF